MENRYTYKGQDITLDIIIKIEHIVRILSKVTEKPFDECLYEFYQSKVYETLQCTESLLWAESAEFIADEFFREQACNNGSCN